MTVKDQVSGSPHSGELPAPIELLAHFARQVGIDAHFVHPNSAHSAHSASPLPSIQSEFPDSSQLAPLLVRSTPTVVTGRGGQAWRAIPLDEATHPLAPGWWALVPEPTSLSAADHTSIDPLTQALDRRAFANWCDLFWNAASGPTVDFALLFIDFDNFKEVNDKYGHVIGDKVLAELVLALKGAIRDGDQLYRYGGDEFVLVAHGIRDTQSLARIVRRVSAAADTTVELPGTRVAVRASVGGAMSGEGFASIDDMLSAADRRMYESKHHPG